MLNGGFGYRYILSGGAWQARLLINVYVSIYEMRIL